MMIDCHVHLNRYEEKQPAALGERVRLLEAAMRRSGVDYALVLSSYRHSPERPSTVEIVRAIEGKPHLGVAAGISLTEPRPGQIEEAAELIRAGKVKALKIYPGYEPFYPSDRRYVPVYELAADSGVPVMIHSGDTYASHAKLKFAHPLQVDEVAVDFPYVNFVICHLGNPWFRDCMEVVYKNKNVYADMSGLVLGDFSTRIEQYLRRQLDDLMLYLGESRWLLFGTDWPICSMRAYAKFMHGLRMAAHDKDKILYENAARLFRIEIGAEIKHAVVPPRRHDPHTRGLRARGARLGDQGDP